MSQALQKPKTQLRIVQDFDTIERKDSRYDPRAHGARCDECPLSSCIVVPPTTVKNPQFVVIGEGPGKMEMRTGEVFVGPSGKLLNRALERAGLERRKAHVTNAMLCKADNEKDVPAALVCCAPRLMRELSSVSPGVPLVPMGAAAAQVVLGVKSILRARGFVWETPTYEDKVLRAAAKSIEKASTRKDYLTAAGVAELKILRAEIPGRTVLPVLHPAFILRSEIWGALLSIDMRRIARFLKNGGLALEDQCDYVLTSQLSQLKRLGSTMAREVTVDIETDSADPLNCKIVCIGFGDTRSAPVIAYPFRPEMVPIFNDIFKKRTAIGHNIILFDKMALRKVGVRLPHVEDTLVAHHALASHLPKSLLHVASAFCDSSPWKHKAKGEGRGEKSVFGKMSDLILAGKSGEINDDVRQFAAYNAADVNLDALAWQRMQNDLESERYVYEIGKVMAELCASMRWIGFRLDVERAGKLSKTLQARKNVLLGEMRKITHHLDFNPRKPADIRKALFGMFRVPLIRPTPKGKPSTGRAVLELLRHNDTKAGRLSDLILRWREADKIQGTYLSVATGGDGRVHSQWRIGPQTGRIAGPLMTLPRYTKDKESGLVDPVDRVRECYIAALGKVLVYFDLSQVEMRYAANLSGDPIFMQACAGDVHAGNARILFPQAVADGSLATDAAAKTLGKEWRDIAKNAGFAVTYLAEWETVYAYLTAHGFAVTPGVCKAMLDRLHRSYKVYFKYVDECIAFVRKNGFLRTVVSGRIRWFGRHPKPTEVANYRIQAGVADYMNERLPEVWRRLPKGAAILAQIHDAAIIECFSKDEKTVKQIVSDVYGPPCVLPDRDGFSIPIDLKVGDRWSQF